MTNMLIFSHGLEDKPWWFYFVENLDKPLKDTTWESGTQSEQQDIVMAPCEHEEALIPLILWNKKKKTATRADMVANTNPEIISCFSPESILPSSHPDWPL